MRCLWLTREWPWPTDRGDLLYAYHLIRSVADAGVELTVVAPERNNQPSFSVDPDDLTSAVSWVQVPHERLRRARSLLSTLPSDTYRNATNPFRAAIRRLLAEHDWSAIVVDHIAMAWALPCIRHARLSSNHVPPIVYISHNHEMSVKPEVARAQQTVLPYKLLLQYDAWKAARLERSLVRQSSLVSAITDEDATSYRQDFPGKAIITTVPGYTGHVTRDRIIGPTVPRSCILFGSLNWIAKRQNVIDFLNIADEKLTASNITIDVVGTVDRDFAQRLRDSFRCVRVIGRVDNVTPYMHDCRIGIMLDRVGGGFKCKQLEYIFHRVPFVSIAEQTRGLPLDGGRDYLSAKNIEELIELIIDHIDDFETLNYMHSSAIEKVEGMFDWTVRGATLKAAIQALRPGVGTVNQYHSGLASHPSQPTHVEV